MPALTPLVPSSFTTSGLYRTDTYHPRSPTAHCDKHLIQLGLQYVKFKRKRAMEMLLCETCGEQFDYRTNLNRHQLQHKPLPKFKCSECTKGYRHMRNLKRHFKAKHTGRILTCDKCRKSFTYKNSLVRHLDTIHRVIHCD